jgi:hypothetical protein
MRGTPYLLSSAETCVAADLEDVVALYEFHRSLLELEIPGGHIPSSHP